MKSFGEAGSMQINTHPTREGVRSLARGKQLEQAGLRRVMSSPLYGEGIQDGFQGRLEHGAD